MSGPVEAARLAEAARAETVGVIEQLAEAARADEIPASTEVLERHRGRLLDNTYKVLVVGEAKRGKSTFINALIGRDILPTDVDVATSQVFHVSRAEREAYRVRFEDGSGQAVTLEDLPKIGSQTVQDELREGGEYAPPDPSKMVRWIEVEVPASFLPPGLSILDTPGMGSLYAPHAEITHRFVPLADAVIFVLDSEKMILDREIEFVETILAVTPHIFFIQTRIDKFGGVWRDTQQRNVEILKARFGERLGDVNVWPVSSENLRAAAAEASGDDAEALLMVARHRELAAALQAFLFRVSGWSRAAAAFLAAAEYHTNARQTLATRLASLTEESKQKLSEFQQREAQRKRNFESEWGERGAQRKALTDGMRKAVVVGKRRMAEALQPGREIAQEIEAEIEAVTTIEEANALGETMWEQVATAASNEWRQVCSLVHAHCDKLLAPFFDAATALVVNAGGELTDSDSGLGDVRGRELEGFKSDWWAKTKAARMDMLTAASLSTVLLFTPLAPLAVVTTLWGLLRGWKSAKEAQVKGAKQELRKHLSNLLLNARAYFTGADLSELRLSRVDEYFDAFEQTMLRHVQTLVSQKAEEMQAELTRLGEVSRLDEQERRERAAGLRVRLGAWDELGKRLAAIGARLKALERPAPASASASAPRQT